MSSIPYIPLRQSVVNGSGRPYAAATATFYRAGTTTALTVYADAARQSSLGSVVTASAAGKFSPIYLDPTYDARCILKDSSGNTLSDDDNIPSSATVSRDGIGDVLYPTISAESGVTVTDSGYPYLDIRRYGATVGVDAITAFNAAVTVAAALGGGDVYVPAGTWTIGSTVTVAGTRVSIVGEGANVSILKFNPASTDVLLHFTNGASSVVQCHVRGLGFYSTNSVTKTAIQMDDARACVIEEIGISQGNWAGSGSIGIHFKGRDTCTVRKLNILCARPILLSQCTNHASLDTDHFHFEDIEVGSTETTGKVIEAEDGVVFSNVTFDGYQAWVLGKYGFYWSDTTSPIDSFNVGFSGVRTEQGSDATGYSFYLSSTANDIKALRFEGCFFDESRNGVYLRKPETVSFDDCYFGGSTGRTNFDITFQSNTELQLQNTFVNTGSTVTLTNGVACVEHPWGSSNRACTATGFWRYNEAALVSRKSRREDGVLSFKYKGTVADDGQLNLPVLSSGGADVAFYSVAMGAATGPILEHAVGAWRPGTVTQTGSSNIATTSSDGKLCVVDNTNALSVINRLGQTCDVVISVVWSD